jgi:flagellar basal-body rod modification protein FlgD
MAESIIPATNPSISAAINQVVGATGSTTSGTATSRVTIARNFETFLQLLTTQLKNQNPLDPLDTNQFTQQLVQFAQVEQQLRSNEQLETLVKLQKAGESALALGFVGSTVVVDGQTTKLKNGQAIWNFAVDKPVSSTVNVKNAAGQVAYTGTFTIQPGPQQFVWDGRGNNGTLWPDGNYTLEVVGKDANGQNVAVSTEVQGVVDSVDLTQNPPLLSIGGQNFSIDKIKRVVARGGI